MGYEKQEKAALAASKSKDTADASKPKKVEASTNAEGSADKLVPGKEAAEESVEANKKA